MAESAPKTAVFDTDKDDDDLILYVSIHSQTERALFHTDHITRIYQLAHAAPPEGLLPGHWFPLRDPLADLLVRRARWFRKFKVLPGGLNEGQKLRGEIPEDQEIGAPENAVPTDGRPYPREVR